MTTLVETSDEEPTLAVARYVAQMAWADADEDISEPAVAQFCVETEGLMASGRNADLVDLLLTSANIIFSRAPEKDVECIFMVICNLVTKADSEEEAMRMSSRITNALTAQAEKTSSLKLKLLFHLYNILKKAPYGRYLIYKQTLSFALSAKLTDLVTPSLKRLDALLKEWNVGVQDQRSLYLVATSVLREGKGASATKDSFNFLLKYLSTFSGEDVQRLTDVREHAVRAAVEFIKAADIFQCDLLEMAAVRQLESDPKYSHVYRLLHIFLTRKLDSYLAFYSDNASVINSLGLNRDDCVTKMRLMSMAALGVESPNGEIPYELVRRTLEVDEDEVEMWVVKAISVKLLEAKMDQMREVVVVNRCLQRVFGPSQWVDLRAKLEIWRENLTNVVRIVHHARLSGSVIPKEIQAAAQ